MDTNYEKFGGTDTIAVANKNAWCPVGCQIGSAVGGLALLSWLHLHSMAQVSEESSHRFFPFKNACPQPEAWG